MNVLLEACLLVVIGIALVRMSGRRSISQMTFASVVIMLTLGAILAEPLARKSLGTTLLITVVILVTLVVLEWLQVRVNAIEKVFSGKPVLVIQDGQVLEENLKKLRISTDKLEMRLRQAGITKITDLKAATIEVNGELGYAWMPKAEPLTVGQFEAAIEKLSARLRDGVAEQGLEDAKNGHNDSMEDS